MLRYGKSVSICDHSCYTKNQHFYEKIFKWKRTLIRDLSNSFQKSILFSKVIKRTYLSKYARKRTSICVQSLVYEDMNSKFTIENCRVNCYWTFY